MEESSSERERRENLLKMYRATKEALNVIGNVTTTTISTPLPPPITEEESDLLSSRNHNNRFGFHDQWRI